MYVDESGDPGLNTYSSKHFLLNGLIVPQDDWQKYLGRLKAFRKSLQETYGLNQRTEIHASELIRIGKLDEYKKIRKIDRIKILELYSEQIPVIFDKAKIISVFLVKANYTEGQDIQEIAWNRLIQRFDNFLKMSVNDKGIIIADDTESKKIIRLLRKMRVYNPILRKEQGEAINHPTDNILEDLFERNSRDSYFIQTVDVLAHLLYRREIVKGSLRKFRLEQYFNNVEPILLKEACKNDEFGIVRK